MVMVAVGGEYVSDGCFQKNERQLTHQSYLDPRLVSIHYERITALQERDHVIDINPSLTQSASSQTPHRAKIIKFKRGSSAGSVTSTPAANVTVNPLIEAH